MRWPRRKVMIGVSAAVAVIGLVAAIIAVLRPGPGTPAKPAARCPRQLYSPFTGEPVPSLGPVLAVKIDNLAPPAADRAHRRRHRSTSSRWKAG